MASPSSYTKRRSPSTTAAPSISSTAQPRSKSTGGFLCKSVLLGLFLIALPFFPSRAPDFVGETVFTKFWELIHLLFVGVAVAYGLCSRRNVESAVDLRVNRVDESSLSYVSRILQVSSVFDQELDNSFDFVDVRSDTHHSSSRASSLEITSDSFVVESESSDEYGKISQVQAWNSQYFQGRSKVVVARPAYGLDGHVTHQPLLGLPVRSLRSALRDNAAHEDSSLPDSFDGSVNENDESMADESFDEVVDAPSSPVTWHCRPDMMGMGDTYPSNFQPLSVDETEYATLKSRSSRSSSSRTSSASRTQNIFSPSRSVSQESFNSNVEELVVEKTLQGSSRSSSPSLPPSPSISTSPPLPELMPDDTHKRVLHSRHYSDSSLLEEDGRNDFEDGSEGSKVRGRKKEFFSKKERGSKSLNLSTAESSRRRSKSRRSYPPESISSPVGGAGDSTTKRRDLQQKSDDHLFEENIGKGLETNHNSLCVKKGRSHDSLELTAEDEKSSESFPALDILSQPTYAKDSRRAIRSSSRGSRETFPEKDVARNSEDETMTKDLPGYNNELKSNSLRTEPQSWRASSKFPLRGKSVRTIRSDRHHGKDLKTDGDSSEDRIETKAESRGRTKSRRQRQEDLSIVLHQAETCSKTEPEDEPEAQQPQVTLEEEEEGWESQSNASHDHNEVDRKAGEFIAKFREQIRLQKLTSGEQPRGGGGGNGRIIRNGHFR